MDAGRETIVRTWLGVCVIASLLAACGDEEASFAALVCNASACDPACMALLRSPPDPQRSRCSPPGPICDYDLNGRTWEYNCGSNQHIECIGSSCPPLDMGETD
jgi:hypothetical protein